MIQLRQYGNRKAYSVIFGGIELYFSYETLVLVSLGTQIFRNPQYYSVTTSKHINQMLSGREATEISHDAWNELVNGLELRINDK